MLSLRLDVMMFADDETRQNVQNSFNCCCQYLQKQIQHVYVN